MRRRRVALGVTAATLVAALAAVAVYRTGSRREERKSRLHSGSLDAGYVDAAACAGCHRAIWDSYRRTGMGRSFDRVRAGTPAAPLSASFYHQSSDRYYRVFERNGMYVQRRHQIGPNGAEINAVEKQIDFVVGSGNHARTYLHRTAAGKLVELPLAWYAEKGGFWNMNPGYDRPDHEDFRREISYECVFCHTGYPELATGMDASGGQALFPVRIPDGIDCQRCHGPGQDHIRAAANNNLDAIRAAIVNPRRLSSERQIEVCMQCHLETTSARLPHSIIRYDRGVFSYRPGEPLANFILHFDHAPDTGYDDKFEIAHQAYRFRKSACFQKSQGRMTCTTCHNPHDAPRGARALEHYTAVCRSCHSEPLQAMIRTGAHPSSGNCIDCHMPRRRTDDVVHVVMTDHFIQRRKPAGDLLAPRAERKESTYAGSVVPYYPRNVAPGDSNDLYVAVAQVKQLTELKEGIPRLREVLDRSRPRVAEPYMELAEAYAETGQVQEAIRFHREALSRNRDLRPAVSGLAKALAAAGQLAEAAGLLEEAARRTPADGVFQGDLGLIYLAQGRTADAVRALRKGAEIDPDRPEVFNNLAGALSRIGDAAAAEEAYRNAIRLQPDLVAAQTSLANLLASRGDLRQAEFHHGRAIFYAPRSAAAYYEYGLALARAERFAEARAQFEAAARLDARHAEAHASAADMLALERRLSPAIDYYRRALAVKPDLPTAHLGLGTALAEQGKSSEAAVHLQAAATASDPAIREQAETALRLLSRR